MILGIETSCDETAAALVTEEGEIRANVVSSQAELHARFGGVVPEIASRRHLELVVAGRPGGARRGGGEPRRRRHGRRHAGAGPDRGAPRRPLRGQGARLGARPAARARRPSPRPRRVALPRARSGRAALPLPARERRSHAPARRPRPRRLPRARHVDRRRRRRGVRQGRAPARARLPGRRRARPARAGRRPGGVLVPGREAGRARLLVLGPEDGAPLRRARSRRRGRGAQGRPRGVVPARDRPGARRARLGPPPSASSSTRSPSSAASPPTASCAPRCPEPASRRSRSAPTTPR